MPREKRTHIVCVPCWANRANEGHEAWRCIDAKCVCCGFKKMEERVREMREVERLASATKGGPKA